MVYFVHCQFGFLPPLPITSYLYFVFCLCLCTVYFAHCQFGFCSPLPIDLDCWCWIVVAGRCICICSCICQFVFCQFGFCSPLPITWDCWCWIVVAGRWHWMTDPDIILHLPIARPTTASSLTANHYTEKHCTALAN